MNFIESWIQPGIGYFITALAVLLLASVAMWIITLQLSWRLEREEPTRISLGTIKVNGEDSAKSGRLFLDSWSRFFPSDDGGLPNMGFAEVPALKIDDQLKFSSDELNTLDIEVSVAGVNVKQVVQTARSLAQAPQWTLEADINTQADRQTMNLYLRCSSQAKGSWYVEQAIAPGAPATGQPSASAQGAGKGEAKNNPNGNAIEAQLSALVDEAVLAFAYDRYKKSPKRKGASTGPEVFPSSAAFAARIRAQYHFRRYGESRGIESHQRDNKFQPASDSTADRHLQQAISWLRTACSLMPERPDLVVLLGVCLAESRSEAEAVAVYSHAIDLFKDLEEKQGNADWYKKYFRARLLRETTRGKQYTVQSVNGAVKNLESLANDIEKRLKSGEDKELQEILAHVYIQLAHNYGRYLALMRHTHIREMFATTGPRELRLDGIELLDLKLVTGQTIDRCLGIIERVKGTPIEADVVRRVESLIPNDRLLERANSVLEDLKRDIATVVNDLQSLSERLKGGKEFPEQAAFDWSRACQAARKISSKSPQLEEILTETLLCYGGLSRLAEELKEEREGEQFFSQIDQIKKRNGRTPRRQEVLESADLMKAIKALNDARRESEAVRKATETTLQELISPGKLEEYHDKLQQQSKAIPSNANAADTFRAAAPLRVEFRSIRWSWIDEDQTNDGWPTTVQLRDVYRSLFKHTHETDRRQRLIDQIYEELQQAVNDSPMEKPLEPSRWATIAGHISRIEPLNTTGVEKDLQALRPTPDASQAPLTQAVAQTLKESKPLWQEEKNKQLTTEYLNGLLTSTNQQRLVRCQVRKLWVGHHHWLQKAEKIKKELDTAWNTPENAYRKQNLAFQYELAAGYTHYRLAAWLDENWSEQQIDELFPLERELDFDEEAVKVKLNVFDKHCRDAIQHLRRANGAGPDHYHVQQYLGLVYGDPRFDREGDFVKLAEQYIARSIKLQTNAYYSRLQAAILQKRKVNRIGVVDDARKWLALGILQADESAKLRPRGPVHIYRVELRAMLEELTSGDEKKKLGHEIDAIWSQAEQFAGFKVGIPDPGLRWVGLMRDFRKQDESAERLQIQRKPKTTPDAAGDETSGTEAESGNAPAKAPPPAAETTAAPAGDQNTPQPGAEADDTTGETSDTDAAAEGKNGGAPPATEADDTTVTVLDWQQQADNLHQRLRALIRDCHILEQVWVVRDFVFEIRQVRMAATRLEEAMENTRFDRMDDETADQVLKAWREINPIDRWRFSPDVKPDTALSE